MGVPSSMIMDTQWKAKVTATISKKTQLKPSTGCLLWKGAVKKCKGRRGGGYGIINVHLPGHDSRTLMRVHRLAYIVHTGNFIPQQNDVSHLCHNSLCVNFHHLSLEPRKINNARKVCHRKRQCQGHGNNYRDCLL